MEISNNINEKAEWFLKLVKKCYQGQTLTLSKICFILKCGQTYGTFFINYMAENYQGLRKISEIDPITKRKRVALKIN